MSKTLIIYHANCIDGFTAAWAAARAIETDVTGSSTELHPAQYGDKPPDVLDRHVIVVDFSYPREVMLEMFDKAATLLVLDHHKTAKEALQGLDFAVFDTGRSGAGLAWDTLIATPRPWLIDYVEDRDLWLWKLPRSCEVSAALASHAFDLVTWDLLRFATVDSVAEEGAAILRYQEKIVDKHCEKPSRVVVDGYDVPIVNATSLQSEIGNRLSKDEPFAIMWFSLGDGEYVYSMRSNKNGIDVSEIAKMYGGGGHRHAAGFKSTVRYF